MNNAAMRVVDEYSAATGDTALRSSVIAEARSAHYRREYTVLGAGASWEGNQRTVLRNYGAIETMLKRAVTDLPAAQKNAAMPSLQVFLDHKAKLEKIYSDD